MGHGERDQDGLKGSLESVALVRPMSAIVIGSRNDDSVESESEGI